MNNLSGKPQVMKEVNSSLIKRALKDKSSATKAEISSITGISITTVRTLLEELLINNEIVSLGLDDSSGGRRAERYALNLKDNLLLSFCIEEDLIRYVLANPLGDIIEKNTVNFDRNEYKSSLDKFIENITENNSIGVIGIGVPGVVDKGNYFSGNKLNNWKKVDIGNYIEEKFEIPVILENDLNAIALGFSLNYISRMKMINMNSLNLIYIHFSEAGVGAGIIVNGNLIRGENNFAGELGFMPIGNEGHLLNILNNNLEDKNYADVVGKVIAILNCIINPAFIVVGGDTLRKGLIKEINEACKSYAANNIIPKVILSENSSEDYLDGMVYLTSEFMNAGIKLVKNGI